MLEASRMGFKGAPTKHRPLGCTHAANQRIKTKLSLTGYARMLHKEISPRVSGLYSGFRQRQTPPPLKEKATGTSWNENFLCASSSPRCEPRVLNVSRDCDPCQQHGSKEEHWLYEE